ncbi:MAG: 6-pyruvoyl tetrahydropterin synthase family protein [Candidatus Thermoplasmatota archaeon]|nr:6-pyruvoyl tetrahydropterin synthase family protein [Candidatus Thermoplasmatota archaeon]
MTSYIYIDGWKTNIRFSSAHIIPEYEKCGRLHGHTYAVHVKIFGKPDEKGIIMDFSVLKDILKKIVNELDHRVLIPRKSSVVTIKKENDSIKIVSLKKTYVFPIIDCALLPISSTSAENLAQYILDKVVEKIPLSNQIENIEIGVDEGFGQGARMSKTF